MGDRQSMLTCTSSKLRYLAACAALAIVGPALAQPDTPPSEYRVVCDKTCLNQFAERFLDALVNRQPSRVPLAPDVRYTENGVHLAIGDALWATAV